jgi:hypothetical protein
VDGDDGASPLGAAGLSAPLNATNHVTNDADTIRVRVVFLRIGVLQVQV